MKIATILFAVLPVALAQTISCPNGGKVQQGQALVCTVKGGKPPYTWAMLTGSVGSVTGGGANNATGTYTSPARVTMPQVVNGCGAMPPNSILNTAIGALSVHPSNALWMGNVNVVNNLFYAGGEDTNNQVLSTDPATPMVFVYSRPLSMIFPNPYTNLLSEGGMGYTTLQAPGVDNHQLVTYKDTCQEQENYQRYPIGFNGTRCPKCNSGSGVIYDLSSNLFPSPGTDAGGSPFLPLMVHRNEIAAAAAGDKNAIAHAVRITLSALEIDRLANIWPAQANNTVGSTCGDPEATVSVSGTTITYVRGQLHEFPILPPGSAVIIGGKNFTTAGPNTKTTISLTSAPGDTAATSFTEPPANCPPYGARFRLKASVPTPACAASAACQNIVNALIAQGKNYGYILTDIGSAGELDIDGSAQSSADLINALAAFHAIPCNASALEIVDESALNTNQTYTAPSTTWLEAKLDNGLVTPSNGAVLQVTDSANHTVSYSLALQGLGIGVQNATEVVLAGAGVVQFSPWVTGSSNTNFTCSLKGIPPGGSFVAPCGYQAPAIGSISSRANSVMTVTSVADQTVTATFSVVTIPAGADGSFHFSLGKIQPSDYKDTNGITWFLDRKPGSPELFPSNTYALWSDRGTWTGTITAVSPGVFTNGYAVFGGQGNGDVHLNLHGGSGQYRATVYLNNRTPSTGHAAFSMDCNGSNVVPVTDLFTAAGSRGGTVAESCTVAGQEIKVIVRTEAPKTVSAAGFTIQSPCCTKDTMYSYDPSHNLGVNALTVTPLSGSSASVPAPVERGPIVQ